MSKSAELYEMKKERDFELALEQHEADEYLLKKKILEFLDQDHTHTLYGASIRFKMDIEDVYDLFKRNI